MSHYAKVLNSKVIQVIVAEAEFFNTYIDNSPGTWIQTSYNTKGNVHCDIAGQPDNGIAIRGNYAGVGFIYDSVNDVFYPPSPFPSWTLSTASWTWIAPVSRPVDTNRYNWNETTVSWDLIVVTPTEPAMPAGVTVNLPVGVTLPDGIILPAGVTVNPTL